MSTWAEVGVDTHIVDGNGEVWRIAAVDLTEATEGHTGAFRAKNAAGEWVTIKPKPLDTPVTLTNQDGVQIQLLRDQLGAVVIATIDNATKVVTCPRWPETPLSTNLAEFKDHLELVHGMHAGDIKGYAKLVAAHEAGHDESRPHAGKTHPHVHA